MQFEYRIVESAEMPQEDLLNKLGSNGWEMVGIIYRHDMYTLYFKRLITAA